MKLLQKTKRKIADDRRGFTLVELIVVLVILAILAAIMVPSMIGWIDKAKEKEIMLSARNTYLAAQELVYEQYAETKSNSSSISISETDIQEFAKCAGTPKILKDGINDKYVITNFEYAEGNYVATYANDKWEINKNTTLKDLN